jgi:hypothetical protein
VLLSYVVEETTLLNQHNVPRKEPAYWRCARQLAHELWVFLLFLLVSTINIAVKQNIREPKEKVTGKTRITYELTAPVMVKGSKTSWSSGEDSSAARSASLDAHPKKWQEEETRSGQSQNAALTL